MVAVTYCRFLRHYCMRTALFSLLTLVLILVAALLLYALSPWKAPAPASQATATVGAATSTGIQTYSSQALGVSFKYDSANSGIQEAGTTTYVYPKDIQPEEGQFIRRFEKRSSETLTQAIDRQILSGYSTTTCTVTAAQSSVYPATYTKAEITYPAPTDPNAPFWQSASKCNEAYARTNGIRYFLYDSAHPDRFYFVDIGQYPIVVEGTTTWQDTIIVQ